MIRLEVLVPYIGLNQKWSAAKVETTGDHIVLQKLFTSFGGNCYCNSSDILFLDTDIHRGIEYPMTTFLKLTIYWKKFYYWYQTSTYRRKLNNIRVHIHIWYFFN